jgi:N-methylhydantoinase A/oxoprolinase/acetone carboxylase beta subunit
VLGLLAADASLAGGVELDSDAARDAIGTLADELGLDVTGCAEGIRRVAGAEMIRALRVVTVQRGIDPRRFALLPFGGAGPLHATQIADELGIETILCPRASGVLSAVGLAVSARRRDVQQSVLLAGDELTTAAVATAAAELGERARTALGEDQAELSATYELRYKGQAFELAVSASTEPEPQQLREAFETQHDDRYGYSDPAQTLELVTIRVTATVPGADVTLAPSGDDADVDRGTRQATIGGEKVELEVLRGAPPQGTRIKGPAAIDLPESTLIVPAEWSGEVDETGTIHLHRADK